MNELYKPVQREVEFITLHDIVRAFVQHDDLQEIASICDDIRNEAGWTPPSESAHTLLLTSVVLEGVYRWAKRLPHATFTTQRIAYAEGYCGISENYLCDIGISDLFVR